MLQNTDFCIILAGCSLGIVLWLGEVISPVSQAQNRGTPIQAVAQGAVTDDLQRSIQID